MKYLLSLYVLFIFGISFSQNFQGGSFSQVKGLGTPLGISSSGFGNSGTLYPEDKKYNLKNIKVEGSFYLFDEWQNKATLFAKDKKYIVYNINYDIHDSSFITKISEDSIFVFNSNLVDKVLVGEKIFKKINSIDQKTDKFYEVLSSSDSLSLLKTYYTKIIKASPNPMLNRPISKIVQKENYHAYYKGKLLTLKLKKKSIITLLNKNKKEVYAFMKRYNQII